MMKLLPITVVAVALAAGGTASAHHDVPRLADKVVCTKHTAQTKPTKAQCLGRWKTRVRAQLRRDRAQWPTRPVTVRDLRVRHIEFVRWANLALYEAGKGSGWRGVRWQTPTHWTWQGGLGIYQPNGPAVGSPYGNIGALEWPAQVLIAQRIADRWGLSAWEAYRTNPSRYWGAPSVVR